MTPATLKSRQKLLVTLLAIGVILDLAISVALGLTFHRAEQASSQAHIVKVAAYEACLANNDAKRADLARWRAVLVLVKDGRHDPALEKFIAGVDQANLTADAPRDCDRLVP